MNEQRIREIANESSYHAENSVDYYSGIVDGLTWEAKILKVRDLKFAELIVRGCAMKANATALDLRNYPELNGRKYVGDCILKCFGVEE